ncbi:hypothetical protein [Succinivibrio dextrinosolvens]|uniref:Uncharacterized protein n=1 Tax=Succinivibrio dextrinosolvens TaxID=83771 RepID=A0A662ZDH7_9GAMM|nr:hypothetical protein [Succinivibrio dextrinosolvens]SFK58988.1 hypothetical protein SAMN04487865_11265 [Succinivibrio dextrinosolvens]
MSLAGFKKFNLSTGTSSISITQNGVAFSKTAVLRMNKASFVCVYIDEGGKRFAIQEATENDESATRFYNNQKIIAVRWNNKELLKTIQKMMNWELKNNIYRVEGDYDSTENALIFDLNNFTLQSSSQEVIESE